jgi:hypothetical protein
MYAYAAHWLHLAPRHHIPTEKRHDIVRDGWRAARRSMLKVINRASYRSILAMYLFAQTPVPVNISEDEELDGMSAQVCIQTAIYQLQRLRERRANVESTVEHANATALFVDLESRAFWAAMMWDTSSSLTAGARTSLSSGLKGACSEPTWRIVRAFLVGSFATRTERWRDEDFAISNGNASEIIAAGVVCKTYIWKHITSLKEALREGVSDDGVNYAWSALLGAMAIWHTIIRSLLTACERRLHSMDQHVRLNWYSLSIQYHLGIMSLVEVLEASDRSDLIPEIETARQDADEEAYNVLNLGLMSMYKIRRELGDPNGPETLIRAPITAIDPCPQYALNLVLLMFSRLVERLQRKETTQDVYEHLLSILERTLQQLPKSSKAVVEAREYVERLHSDVQVIRVADQT